MVSYDRNLASSNMMLNKKPHMSHIPRFSAGLGSPSPRLGDYGSGRRDRAAEDAYYEQEQASYRANAISHKDSLNLNRPGSTLVNRSQSLKNPYDTSINNNYGRSVDYDSQGRNIGPMTKASNRPEFYRENSGTRSPLNYNRAEANHVRSPRPGAEMSPRHHYQHQLADNRSSISGHDEKNRSTAIAAEPMVNDKHRNRREDLDEINKRYYEFYDKSNAAQHHHHHHEHQLQPQPQPQPHHHHHHDRDYDNHDHGHHHKSNPRKLNKTRMQYIRKKYKNKISANISGTKFDIIRDVLELMGCRILPDDNFDCNLIWDDTRVSIEGISELKAFQHYNHFPAMSEISKKDALARNISKMYKLMPKEFDFVPKTWIMPSEYSNLLSYSLDMRKMHVKKTFIMKPSNGAMGHGIKLFKNVEKIQPTENYIVQEYINNPYLIDGFKFDMRIYALVTSCDPLRAFIYEDGLVRLGTEEYHEPNESNIDHLYMHLTNYSVNKRNKSNYDEGDENGERGSKRSLAFLFEHLRRNNKDADLVWRNIQDIILKTILVAEPYLFHTYKMCRPGQIAGTESVCFEILGFDILLDEKMKPWVLEVNRCPSFGANQDIDKRIKTHLLIDSFELLHLRPTDRLKVQTLEKAEAKKRLYNLTSYSSKSDLNSLNNESSSLLQSKTIQSSSSSNLSSYSTIKKYKPKEKRKLELIEQIKILRREQRRQDYENRNRGNYIRLFPKEDKHDMEYYLNILNAAFNLFYPVGKHLQWKKTYEKIKEDELLNELVEFDDEIYDSTNYEQNRKLNEYLKDDYTSTESEESVNSDEEDDASYEHRLDSYYDRNRAHRHDHHHHHDHHQQRDNVEGGDRINEPKLNKSPSMKNFVEQQTIKSNRLVALVNAVSTPSLSKLSTYSSTSNSNSNNNRITSKLTRDTGAFNDSKTLDVMNANSNQSNMQHLLTKIRLHQAKQNDPDLFAKKHNAENSTSQAAKNNNNANNDDKLTDLSNSNLAHLNSAFLKLLTQLEIKYPGKDSQETRSILQKIYTKFEMYKPKLANYWMAKLDDAKRNKILGIVKSNVIVLLKKVYMIDELEKLRMYKILVKLLNRMLWMHGLGLWNCFVNSNNSSWESIFSKSSFQISESELKCCYRMVELCKDCLLIVYQYAFEQKSNEKESPGASNTPTSLKSNRPYLPLAASNTNSSSINQKTRIKNN